MSISKLFLRIFVCLAVLTAAATAGEYVLVLPGAGGSNTQIPVFTANPFVGQNSFTSAAQGTFLVLTTPDGQKNYVISNTGTTGVAVYDQNFNGGHVIGNITTAPTTAALSPDGRWLSVLAGGAVYIFDTATDTLATSTALSVSGSAIDVAFALDSSRAFILSNNGNAGVVTPLDLTTRVLGTSLILPGAGAGIGIGPTGLLYVTTPNRLFEINPRTLAVTSNGEIPVNANPSKPVFTPDGKYALSINRTPITGSSVLLFDLGNHTLAGAFPNFSDPQDSSHTTIALDKLVVAGNNRIFAYASQNNKIYEITVANGINIIASTLQNLLPNIITGIAVANDSPARNAYVLAVTNGINSLYKVDLATTSVVSSFTVPNAAGQIISYAAPNPTSGAVTLAAFNATQTVQPGATSLPLVVRLQDSLGRPVFGGRVDFSSSAATGTLNPVSTTTNSDGYAQTYAIVPSTPGGVTITATSPGVATPGTFTLTVPGSGGGGGGGGGGTQAAINILSGNGQVITEFSPFTQSPLIVQVTDANGNPAPNVAVTFSITQGKGALLTGSPYTVLTDNLGRAQTSYQGVQVDFGLSFQQATITASTSIGSVNFTVTTLLSQQFNGSLAPPPNIDLILPDFSVNPSRIITGGAGSTIKGAIKIQVVTATLPQLGAPIPNVAVSLSTFENADPTKVPSAKCANQPVTDANGIAVCDVVLGNVLGTGTAVVNAGTVTKLVLLQITVGPPSIITIAGGDQQSGKPGTRLPQSLRVVVTDSAKNPLQNIPLAWSVTQGSATLSATNTTTDINGSGQTNVTLGSTAGTVTVKVTAGTGASAVSNTFTLTSTVAVTGISIFSGDAQTASIGQAFATPLAVTVTDATGATVSGIAVNWTVNSGLASLSAASSNTDQNGRASINVTAGAGAGPVVITATTSGLSTTFNLTVRTPGPLVNTSSFTNAASGAVGLTPCGIAIVSAPNLVPNQSGTLVANTLIGPLPTQLGGADLTVNGIAAPIFWVSNGAIAFQTPCETGAGTATVVVRVTGGSTTVTGVSVVAVQPGIFETIYNNKKYAVLLHADGSYVTPASPAARGEQIKLFATGLGTTTPRTNTGGVGTGGQKVDASLLVGVSNSGARIVNAEYLQGGTGLYVVTFEVPSGPVPPNTDPSYQPLALAVTDTAGNAIFGNPAYLPIQP